MTSYSSLDQTCYVFYICAKARTCSRKSNKLEPLRIFSSPGADYMEILESSWNLKLSQFWFLCRKRASGKSFLKKLLVSYHQIMKTADMFRFSKANAMWKLRYKYIAFSEFRVLYICSTLALASHFWT